jgi:YaiO family outer membrane protein
MIATIRCFAFTLLAAAPLLVSGQIRLFDKGPDADSLYSRAVTEVKQGRYDQALADARQALASQPGNIDYMVLTGRICLLKKDFARAASYLQQAIKKDPRYKEPYLLMANSQLGMKHYTEAVHWLDQGLHYLKADRELALKKLSVLDAAGYFYSGDRLADSLVENFPHDSAAHKAFVGHYMVAGYYYARSGATRPAVESFQKVLTAAPGDTAARDALRGLYLTSGNYQSAMDQVNSQLTAEPDNYQLLMKKLGLLEQLHQYADALDVLHTLSARYPGDAKVRALQVSLRMEAARYYSSLDPENLYKEVWTRDPGNREALDKVIGMATSRDAYDEALEWVRSGLKRFPGDRKLLGTEMDLLERLGRYGAAAQTAGELYRRDPAAPAAREHYVMLMNKTGQQYMAGQQYELAGEAFEEALRVSPTDSTALERMSAVLVLRKDTADALAALDKLVAAYPASPRFAVRKAGLLTEAGRFEEALSVIKGLRGRYAGNAGYRADQVYMELLAARSALGAGELPEAREHFAGVLAVEPDNAQALLGMVNLYGQMGMADSALAYLDTALRYMPEDRDLLARKAGWLAQAGRYAEADTLAYGLMRRYPYNARYRDAYLDAVRAAGKHYMDREQPDSALECFGKLLSVSPSDSLGLLYQVNLLGERHSRDSALAYTAQALRYYPGNEVFLRKRATLLEADSLFEQAAAVADTLARLYPDPHNKDYRDYLGAKTLKNQFGLMFSNSSYDYSHNQYKIASVEYRHFIPRGSYAFYLNYAARQQGTSLQGQGEIYYKHGTRMYSYGLLAYSAGQAFPRWRLAYSLFRSFPLDIEGELGARYLEADSTRSIAGVASVAKTWDDFWMNLRAYFIRDAPHFYTSYNYTLRYFTNPRKDYLSLVAGLGTSPDDKSRLIEFPKLAGLLTRSVGVGYMKNFHYKTKLGLFATWINQKISTTTFENQYDIYISLERLF